MAPDKCMKDDFSEHTAEDDSQQTHGNNKQNKTKTTKSTSQTPTPNEHMAEDDSK